MCVCYNAVVQEKKITSLYGKEIIMRYFAVVHNFGNDVVLNKPVEHMTGCVTEDDREMFEHFDLFDENDRFVEITEEEYNILCNVYTKIRYEDIDFGEMYGGEGLLCD